MPQKLLSLISLLCVGLMMGCSGGSGDESGPDVIVVGGEVSDANVTTGVVTANDDPVMSDPTVSPTGNDTSTGGVVSDDGVASGTDEGATTGAIDDENVGLTPFPMDDGATDVGADDGGIDAGADAGADDGGTDAGADDGGTDTGAVDGVTDAGADVGGTDAGAVDGGTDAGAVDGGTDAGADDGGIGSTTSGSDEYPVGSLAYVLENEPNLSLAFAAIKEAGLDLAIDDPINAWTLFLPTNTALSAEPNFDVARHLHIFGARDSTSLASPTPLPLIMSDGGTRFVERGLDGAQLSIDGVLILATDLVGNRSSTTVHIINSVLSLDSAAQSPKGTLANVLSRRGDVSLALKGLRENGIDLSLDDPGNQWTLFLPTDASFEASAIFIGRRHIYDAAAMTSTQLTGISGMSISMSSSDEVPIAGGGNEPLSIGGFKIIEADVQNDDMVGSVVHIIEGVLLPSTPTTIKQR